METSVLLYGEAEAYVQSLDIFTVKEIGSPRWFKQHEYLEKLNMQAILNASTAQEEFIKELLVIHGKQIPILVHEMILVEIWKQKVLPILCQLQDFNPKSTFPLYMVVHHEATIINLLETVMFHKDSCDAAEDSLHDLVDYCHRKLTLLVGRASTGEHLALGTQRDLSALKELQEQNACLEFEISLKALAVLRYITDHADSIAVINRMLCTHNLPCLLVQMVEHCPWSRYSSGKTEKYIDGKWQKIPPQDHLKMTKLDGQVWIALYNLLLKEDCQRKYDFNSFNKNQLLKLRGYLTEVLMDQLPNLVELQRFLGHLGVTDPAPPKKDFVLEQIAEMWNSIMRDNSGKWKAIAKYQVKETFNPSESVLREQAQRLAQTYNLDVMENMLPDKPKCGACGKEAAKRCSRCQGEWYCHRECQVKHWPKHKVACQLMAEGSEKLQQDQDSQALD